MRIYAGRRHREALAAMKHALATNKDRGAQAMKEALAQVAEAGRNAGATLADTRKPPPPVVPGRRPKPATPAPEKKPPVVVPGRRIRPVGDPLVEAVQTAFPGARLVDIVRAEVVDESEPAWWPKLREVARKCSEQGLIYCGPFPARPPSPPQPRPEKPFIYTFPPSMGRHGPAVG